MPPAGFGGFKETLAGSLCALLFPCRVWRVRAALCCRFCAVSSRSRRRWAYRRGSCRRACRPAHTRRSLRSLWAVRRGRRKIPRHCAFHSQCELVGKFARLLKPIWNAGKFSTNSVSSFGATGRFFTSGDSSTRSAAIQPLALFMVGAENPPR